MASRQSLFRSQAREQYARRRDKTVLPRLVMPPAFLCLWLLLGLLLLATGLAWQAQVPIYASAPGTIVPPQLNSNQPTASGPETCFLCPRPPRQPCTLMKQSPYGSRWRRSLLGPLSRLSRAC